MINLDYSIFQKDSFLSDTIYANRLNLLDAGIMLGQFLGKTIPGRCIFTFGCINDLLGVKISENTEVVVPFSGT